MESALTPVKKKSKKKRIIIISIIVVVILVAVLVIPRFFGPLAGGSTASSFGETTVKTGNISTTVEGSGNIEDNEITIEIPYDVMVNDIKVDEGDYVNAGDKLVTVYSSSLESKIEDVEDEIDDINDKIDDQKDNSENVKALKERKSELTSIKKALNKVAKNNVIYASGNGTVGTISISEGSKLSDDEDTDATSTDSADTTSTESSSTVSSGSDSMSLTSIRDDYFGSAMTIDSNDTVSMEVDIDELDIATVKKGQDATVTLDAVTDQEFTGKVTKINSDISINNGVVKYSAKIESEKSSEMKTGMSADVTIVKESKENVLLIPADAVQENAEGLFVYTSLKDDTLGGITKITTGLSDGTNVEVVTGLSEGDKIYYTKASADSTEQNPFMMQGGPGNGDMPSGEMPSGGPDGSGSGGGQVPTQGSN